MKQVFEKGTKIQVVHSTSDNWYKVDEIYTVHSYLEHKDAYVVEEQYEVYKDSAWIDAEDVEMYIDWSKAPEGATHYNNVDCIEPWLKMNADGKWYYNTRDETWIEYGVAKHIWAFHFDNAIKRPVEDEKNEMQDIDWYTKGQLPPVGSVCLHAPCDQYIDPFEVTILAHHKFHGDEYKCAVWVHENDVSYSSVECFMPMSPTPKKEQEMNEWKDGLPPVGTEFEYSLGNGYWFKAVSKYVVGDSGVVALCEVMGATIEQYLDNEECEFRPIKSKEQEKEESIAEMIWVAEPNGHLYNTARLFCERLFNSGWRKVE